VIGYLWQYLFPTLAVTVIVFAVWYLIDRAGSAMDQEFQVSSLSTEELDRLQRYVLKVRTNLIFSLEEARDFRDLAVRLRAGARGEPDRSIRDILVSVATALEREIERTGA
jgi:hypothetical protein